MATAAVICACGGNGSDSTAAQSPVPAAAVQQATLVEVMSAPVQNVPQESVYSTTVQANIVNNIAPQTSGRIVKINSEIGDFVSKGQVLALMDDAQLKQAEFQLVNSKNDLERVRTLLPEGGISQSDFDQLEMSYNVAKAAYDNLKENTILQSPVSGVVTARNYDCGDMYSMSQPLFTVQQITPVKMLVGISETDYTKVSKGDKVKLVADAFPEREFSGTIVRLYPTMDSSTHTFNVEVQVRNEDRSLRPGMYVRATVDFGSRESVVLPDAAVQKLQGAGTRNVFILEPDGTVSLRVVTLGRHFDGKYEILSGISEGEQVVVKGASSLKAGQKVEVAR